MARSSTSRRLPRMRRTADEAIARNAGAHHVVHVGPDMIQQVRALVLSSVVMVLSGSL